MLELAVPDISCSHCAQSISAAVSPLPGVHSVSVDVPTRTVRLQPADGFSIDQVRAAIDEAGYSVTAVNEQSE